MSRRSVVLAVVLPLVLVLAVGGTFAVLTLDRQARRTLPSGAMVEGVEVGGLTTTQAVGRLRQRLETPLHRPVKLTTEGFSVDTSPWDLGYRVDVAGAVRQAMRPSLKGNVVSRVVGKVITSTPPIVEARPRWVPGGLDDVLGRAAKALEIAPKDADIEYSTGWVKFLPEKAGRTLDAEASRKAVMDGVAVGDSTVRLVTSATKANADPSLSKVILIRAGENKLYLYENGKISKSWPVATGSSGYLTPTGVWHVVNKIVGPVWYNPGSSWAKGLPARIGPGPGNPLGTHALELDAPAILIHATSDTGSIGYSVSHGCIRMTEADELELFDQVTPGTRVVIAQVAPPRPRGAPVVENAATLF
jgi:hypothetical protein